MGRRILTNLVTKTKKPTSMTRGTSERMMQNAISGEIISLILQIRTPVPYRLLM